MSHDQNQVVWLRESCQHGKSCPGYGKLKGRGLVRGYVVTDPELLANLPEGGACSG